MSNLYREPSIDASYQVSYHFFFIEICTFVSWIHEVPVPYPGIVNISKANIYKDVSIC